ncbi:ubiquitin-protein ligase peroxin 12 [Malassezia brasiliensis]|uniref:Peroxisome assembly protein 12 n=1 Tax=Malassezia brasiliensis TaxID=1821822 RepID=A0AAF0DYU4_9BASI|nr:ubiquitin-protein ligase peroxin 12 [Malassezia brasiliensis]
MDILSSVDPTASGGTLADPYRPSFFELIAQEQLSQLLKPAVRYVLTVLAQRNPRYLLRIVNRFDELYALLMLAIDHHYLRTWNASFTENFYGLMRRRRPAVSAKRAASAVSHSTLLASQRLRTREVRASLVYLVVLPYLGTKLTQYYEHLGGGTGVDDVLLDDAPTLRRDAPDLRARIEDAFRKGYPYAQVAYQLWMLAYNIGYLFNRTPYWRPWLRWMRVDVRRMRGDEEPHTQAARALPSPWRAPLLFTVLLTRRGAGLVFELLKYALPASIFFFKFLEWWYSPSNPRRRRGDDGAGTGGAPVQPPAPLRPSDAGVMTHRPPTYQDAHILTRGLPDAGLFADDEAPPALVHNVCPLCGAAPIQNACVLGTGYAFCYTSTGVR